MGRKAPKAACTRTAGRPRRPTRAPPRTTTVRCRRSSNPREELKSLLHIPRTNLPAPSSRGDPRVLGRQSVCRRRRATCPVPGRCATAQSRRRAIRRSLLHRRAARRLPPGSRPTPLCRPTSSAAAGRPRPRSPARSKRPQNATGRAEARTGRRAPSRAASLAGRPPSSIPTRLDSCRRRWVGAGSRGRLQTSRSRPPRCRHSRDLTLSPRTTRHLSKTGAVSRRPNTSHRPATALASRRRRPRLPALLCNSITRSCSTRTSPSSPTACRPRSTSITGVGRSLRPCRREHCMATSCRTHRWAPLRSSSILIGNGRRSPHRGTHGPSRPTRMPSCRRRSKRHATRRKSGACAPGRRPAARSRVHHRAARASIATPPATSRCQTRSRSCLNRSRTCSDRVARPRPAPAAMSPPSPTWPRWKSSS